MCKEIEIEWVAHWSCPKCDELTDSCDPWVDDDGDRFVVESCDHDFDNGGLNLVSCGHKYTVSKREWAR